MRFRQELVSEATWPEVAELLGLAQSARALRRQRSVVLQRGRTLKRVTTRPAVTVVMERVWSAWDRALRSLYTVGVVGFSWQCRGSEEEPRAVEKEVKNEWRGPRWYTIINIS